MISSLQRIFLCLLSACALLLAARPAAASCVLTITKVTPCLSTGAPGTPQIGTTYGIRVNFNVAGTAKPFGIKFTIANVTHTFNGYNLRAGNGYYSYCLANLCLDDAIPYSVTIDPANVSGNTNPHTTVSGTFSPAPPATIVQSYSPVTRTGANSRTITFAPGSAVSTLDVLLGVPTTHGAQTVVSTTAPAGSSTVMTPPYGLPVYEVLNSNLSGGSYTFSNSFTVTLSKMRVNPTLLRKITWATINALPTEYTQWLAADTINEATDSSIVNFVANALPSDYRTSMTPYDAARTLHRAVMRSMTYVEPPPHDDAVASLAAGQGDCGCYAAVLVSALRSIGIPARRIAGFWQGFSQSHIRVEFYMPGAGWLVADPTLGNGQDPTGTYAYYFGSVSDGDKFVAVDVADDHELTDPTLSSQDLQTPNFWYTTSSSATIASDTFFSYLQTGATTEYTLLLQATQNAAGIPQGIGYGLLTLSDTGGIILSGQLADGQSYSTTGSLGGTDGDQFVFNTPLAYAGSQGSLSGTLNFVTTTGPFETTGTGDLGGTIGWAKPQTTGNYPGAFQTSLAVAGSLYNPPTAGVSVLPGFTKGVLTLSGTGDLTAAGATELQKDVTLTAANALTIANPGKDKLKIAITPATGVFKGTFMDIKPGGSPGVLTSFTGVVFQQEAIGGGFFLGTNNAGSVNLVP
jgi:transglutaminase-like putative cysteine protease